MYDQTSGQVFKEWTMSRDALTPQHDRGWHSRPPWLESSHLKTTGDQGPRTLIEMATHVIVENIGDITQRHLDHLPRSLVWRIWRFFEAR